MYKKILKAIPKTSTQRVIAILGLTFKPNTDDMRDSPSLDIIPSLIKQKCKLRVFDPEGMTEAKKYLSNVKDKIYWCKSAYEACNKSDGLVILTEWNQFRALDMNKLKNLLKRKIIVDLRNIYNPKEVKENGFKYFSIGRNE